MSLKLPKNKINSIINIPKIVDNIFSPKVVVTYIRDYFVSSSGTTRITFDYQINYSIITNNLEMYNVSNWLPDESSVLELKYDYLEKNNSLIDRIVCKLAIQTSRFSKYCNAISSIYS